MATPIRWDNIRGPSLAEASAPLQAAQRSFLSGFQGIGDALASREAIDQANWQNDRTNNTNAFLDALNKYQSPEALRAAQRDGSLDKLRASFGANIDANAVRGAADSRIAALQGQAQQEIGYNHMMTDERVAPLLDQYKRAVLAGDKMAARSAQAQYEQLGGRDLAGLAAYSDARGEEMKMRGRGDILFANQQTKFTDDLKTSAAQRSNMAAQTAIAKANSDSNIGMTNFTMERTRKQDDAAIAAGRAAAAQQQLSKAGNVYAGGVYDGSQANELLQELTKNNIGDNNEDRTQIIKYLNRLASEGVEVVAPDGKTTTKIHKLPMSAVTAAALGASDSWYRVGWNTGAAKDFKASLEAALGQTGYNEKGELVNKADFDRQAFERIMRSARENAPAIVPNRPPRTK